MKYRIVYHLASPLRARTREAAHAELSMQSDDIVEYAMSAPGKYSASLQESEDGKHWKTLTSIDE